MNMRFDGKALNIPIGQNGTKPFNLGAMLLGKTVVTRDGREFKLAGVNIEADEENQIAGWIEGELLGFDLNGVFSKHSPYSNMNLVIKG